MAMRTVLMLVGLPCLAMATDFFTGMDRHIGCFYDVSQDRDLATPAALEQPLTIKACTGACAGLYYKYAGMQAGRSCYCGGSYGRHGPGSCSTRCEGNTTQTCGGPSSNTVYGTGYARPGPPSSMDLVTKTPTSLYINWTAPASTNGKLTEYQVTLTLVSSHHPTSGRASPLTQRFSESADSARLNDLLPGSQYKVEVAAVSAEGAGPTTSRLLWTEVGEPEAAATPEVLPGSRPGQLRVRLQEVAARGGPVTAYQVIVLDASLHRSFVPDQFVNYNKAKELGLQYWVAAQLRPNQLGEFLVGNGRLYGGFWNHELPHGSGQEWRVGLAVISTLDGTTKRSYSGNHMEERVGVVREEEETGSGSPSSLVIGLTVATVVAALVLVAALAVFIYLRRSLGTRFRRRGDTQELTAQPSAAIDLGTGADYLGDGRSLTKPSPHPQVHTQTR